MGSCPHKTEKYIFPMRAVDDHLEKFYFYSRGKPSVALNQQRSSASDKKLKLNLRFHKITMLTVNSNQRSEAC
jgi:hypothetical protein